MKKAEPAPVTTQIAARGKRAAAPTVAVPWWVEYWQPLAIAAVMAVVSVALFFVAHRYAEEQTTPVLAVEQTLDSVQVVGRHGATPVLELSAPLDLDGIEFRQQRYGDGRVIEPGTPVLLSVSAFDGKTAEFLQEDGQPNLVLGWADPAQLGETLAGVVTGSTEGSRFVVARKLSSGQPEVDVVDVLYTIARGTVIDAPGPLTISASDTGLSVYHEAVEPPVEVTTQVLIQGHGPQVKEGDQVVAQYLAVNWTDGQTVASTWDQGAPRLVAMAEAYPGLRAAVVDQRVGSRIAVVVPPDMSTGEDTLCVVVDILGTMSGTGTDSEQS